MCKLPDNISPAAAPRRPYVAFRYAKPVIEDTYAALRADGFGERGRAIMLSQYL